MAKDIFFNSVPPERETPQNEPNRPDEGFEDISEQTFRKKPQPARPYVRPAPERPPRRTEAPAAAAVPPAAPAKSKRRKKKGCFGRAVAVLLLLVVVIAGVAGVTAVRAYNYVLADYETTPLEENAYVNKRDLLHDADIFNILLLGVDFGEPGEATRSDAMILLSLDTVHNKIKLTSFMRDMYVEIPGYGHTKLNHSCMYGGPQLTVDTIEKDFGVDIDAYVKINYGTFVDVVNGVGGITVAEIDETEAAALADEDVYLGPGTNIHLDGGQALQYVRIRHGQSDFARTERQREAITLILQQARKLKPKQLLSLARDVAGKVESSIPRSKFLSIGKKALKCALGGEILQQQIPADGAWEDGYRDSLMVLLIDEEANRSVIRNFIYEK